MAEAVAQDVRAAGEAAQVVQGDVTDPGDVTRLVDAVVGHWGRLDVLVHNAMTPFPVASFADLSWEQLGTKLDQKMRAAYLLTHAVLPGMIDRRYGRLVYLSTGLSRPREKRPMSEGTHGVLGEPLVRTNDLVQRVTEMVSRHTVTPVHPGGFTVQIRGVETPGLSLLDMDYGMPLRLTAEPLPEYTGVLLPVAGSITAVGARRTASIATRRRPSPGSNGQVNEDQHPKSDITVRRAVERCLKVWRRPPIGHSFVEAPTREALTLSRRVSDHLDPVDHAVLLLRDRSGDLGEALGGLQTCSAGDETRGYW